MKTYYTVTYIENGARNVVWFTNLAKAQHFHDLTPNSSIHGKYQAFSDDAVQEVEQAIAEHDTWRWSE